MADSSIDSSLIPVNFFKAISKASSKDLFFVLAHEFSQLLKVRAIRVLYLTDVESLRVQAAVLCVDGELLECGAPYKAEPLSERTFAQGRLSLQANLAENLQLQGPLSNMGLKSYFGRALKTESGEVVGCVELFDDKPLDNLALAEALISFLEERMSFELLQRKGEFCQLESAQELSRLYESLPQGVVYHAADGHIISANPAALEALGLTRDQIMGRTSHDSRWKTVREDGSLLSGDEHPSSIALRTGQVVKNFVVGVFNPISDSHRWLEVTAVPLFRLGENKPYQVYACFNDITKRKEAQAQRAASEKRFEALFNHMAEGMALHELILDEDGKMLNYRLLDVNPSYEQILGLKREAVINKLANEVYQSVEPPYLKEFGTVALDGIPYCFETYFAPMQKHFQISVVCLEHKRFATIFFDVTQRKNAEAQLAAERERLAVTLASIGDGVIATDTAGRITLLGKVAEEMTGWRQDEAIGRPLAEVFKIVHEGDRRPISDPVQKVLQFGGIVELANHTMLISRDGRERIIADSAAPIRDPFSRIIGVVLVFRDVTVETKLSQEVQRAAKLESLGVLAGGIAHDFNNLLGAISGNAGLAERALERNEMQRAKRCLSDVENATIRARDLTQQLLTFAKGGTPVKKVLELPKLLKESASFAMTGSSHSCEFEFDSLWSVQADAGQISQVLNNLILNACESMPTPGTIKICAKNVVVSEKLAILPLVAGPYVKVDVIDSGVGILPEIKDRIFDPFFTTKQRGSGLGLASVYSIIRAHEGYIRVDSVPGEGSVFSFYLPAIASEQPIVMEPQVEPTKHSGKKVLIMDDEDLLRTMLSESLCDLGHEVVAVENGQRAISEFKLAKESGRDFDLLIFDLTVPGGMGGREAVKAIREIDKMVPVIASSGYATDAVLSDLASYGFTAGLVKPYRLAELERVVSEVLTERKSVGPQKARP